jgi:hypothetical protein
MDDQEFQDEYEKTVAESAVIELHHVMPPHHSSKDKFNYIDLDEVADGLTQSQRDEIADALERWASWCEGAEA